VLTNTSGKGHAPALKRRALTIYLEVGVNTHALLSSD